MYYPKLNEIPSTRDQVDVFKGYNHNLRIGEGEFYDMKNLTSDHFPVLSPRRKRGTFLTTKNPNGMCSNTSFCYVDGRYFYIDDTPYDLKLTDDTKELVSMGSNIIIMPDQKYINTVEVSERGNLRAGIFDLPDKIQGSSIEPKVKIIAVSRIDTTFYAREEPLIIVRSGGALPPATKENKGTIAFKWNQNPTDTSGKPQPPQYNIYHCAGSVVDSGYEWREGTPYDGDNTFKIGIYSEDDDAEYWDYTINQISEAIANDNKVIVSGLYEDMSSMNRTLYSTKFMVDHVVEKNGLVVSICPDYRALKDPADKNAFVEWLFDGVDTIKTKTTANSISVETSEAKNSLMPKMDYIIESGNRLWGCRYGLNNEGKFVNEIYASELGNFKQWNKFEGTSTDSYVAGLGVSGEFTGAVNYGGYPIFFKEDCIIKVYGNYPANFQVQTISCKGVQKGCAKSLAIVNEILYYKSRSAICAYDGSSPIEISPQMADVQYEKAVGGALGNKYYVSMKKVGLEDFDLFVFDSSKGLWHKEDDTDVAQFCNHEGELYYIDRADNYIKSIKGTGRLEEDPIHWGAETGIIGATTPDNKYMSRIDIRMSIAKRSKVSLHIEYDSSGVWERLIETEGLTLSTVTIPVKPRRCDHFRLKFEGEGEAKIFSITKTMEVSG